MVHRRLSRSAYEQVFLRLVSGESLRLSGRTFRPVGMRGWHGHKTESTS